MSPQNFWSHPTGFPNLESLTRPFDPNYPTPMPVPGFTWVQLGIEQAKELGGLIHRIEAFDKLPFRTSLQEVKDFFTVSRDWHCIAALDQQSRMFAFAGARPRTETNTVVCSGGVDPAARGKGLGKACLIWEREQALRLIDPTRAGQILFYVEDQRPDLSRILTDLGYQRGESFHEVSRELTQLPACGPSDPYLEVMPWNQEFDELARQAANQMLESISGGVGITPEEWQSQKSGIRPEISFVAFDKRSDRWQLRGFALCSVYAQDWAAVGTRQGYVDLLCVLPKENQHPAIQETKVAGMLLSRVLQAFKDYGLSSAAASLPAQADALTGGIFTEFGFQTHASTTEYRIELPAQETQDYRD